MFEDLAHLKVHKDSPFDQPTEQLGDDAVADLKVSQPLLPDDYLSYLAVVGFGSLGRESFMIFGGPVAPDEVYGSVPEGMEDVVLIGDDFAGYCVGIDLRSPAVIEADANGKAAVIASSFEIFIRNKVTELMAG